MMKNRLGDWLAKLHRLVVCSAALLLSACSVVQFRPVATIDQVRANEGYRLQQALEQTQAKENAVLMMISGGGTRAAAFGYGVLEELSRHPVKLGGQDGSWLEHVDVVYGVSGGSVLAAYFALHGKDVIPAFENRFLKQNFQRQLVKQVVSLVNVPRLSSPEFGRGDLLQEQFELTLFGNATFGDLLRRRKGPFAVISATDMTAGRRIDFTQEYFDILCLSLADLRIARAVAASSAVPLVFAPVTLNNNGGNCRYAVPQSFRQALEEGPSQALERSHQAYQAQIGYYANSSQRPYLHLLDGGLTDNLGLRQLLELNEIYSPKTLENRFVGSITKRLIFIIINAQNQIGSDIDKSAAIPGFADALNAIINIPIDQHSQEALRRFRALVGEVNQSMRNQNGEKINAYFISLNLHDLPESPLRHQVLNLPTSFYLPPADINRLKAAAPILLKQSAEYQRLLQDLEKERKPEAEPNAMAGPLPH